MVSCDGEWVFKKLWGFIFDCAMTIFKRIQPDYLTNMK